MNAVVSVGKINNIFPLHHSEACGGGSAQLKNIVAYFQTCQFIILAYRIVFKVLLVLHSFSVKNCENLLNP